MAGEEWARRILEKELGLVVVVHDDGSENGMYDLRVGPVDAPEIAIECAGAVDPVFTETWNIGPAKDPLQLQLKGDWTVIIEMDAQVKAIKRGIEPLLRKLEERGVDNAHVDYRLRRYDDALFDELDALKIIQAICYRQRGTGKVTLGMPGIGGGVDNTGASIPEWVGQFLRHPEREDVLRKLQRSKAADCNVFVLVSFGGAPWSVEGYLTGALDQLPSKAPDLPAPVTGIWLVAGLGQRGLCWDGGMWR